MQAGTGMSRIGVLPDAERWRLGLRRWRGVRRETRAGPRGVEAAPAQPPGGNCNCPATNAMPLLSPYVAAVTVGPPARQMWRRGRDGHHSTLSCDDAEKLRPISWQL